MKRATLFLTLTVVLAATLTGAVAAPALAEESTDDYVDIEVDVNEDDEIIVINVDTNTDHNITDTDEELPAIDLSGLEDGTTVTFDWSAVDADELTLEDDEGDTVETDDGDHLEDDTGTLEVDWTDDLDSDADEYRFSNAYGDEGDEDAIGQLGEDGLFGGGVSAPDDLDSTSLGIGAVGAVVLLGGGIFLAGRAN